MMGSRLTEDDVLEKNTSLIRAWCHKYGKGLEREDAVQIGSQGFLRAVRTWRKGYSLFHDYAEKEVYAALCEARRRRNSMFRIEGRFSLDQPIKNDSTTQRSYVLFAQTGDFVNALVFREFLESLPRTLRRTANEILWGYYLEEIMIRNDLTHEMLTKQTLLIGKCWERYNAEI